MSHNGESTRGAIAINRQLTDSLKREAKHRHAVHRPVAVIGGYDSGKASLIRRLITSSTIEPWSTARRAQHVATIRAFTMELVRAVWLWCDRGGGGGSTRQLMHHQRIGMVLTVPQLTVADDDAIMIQLWWTGATDIRTDDTMTQLQLLSTSITAVTTEHTTAAHAWRGVHQLWRKAFIEAPSLPYPFTHATEYYLASFHRIMRSSYEPTDVDISLCALQPHTRASSMFTCTQLRCDASLQCLPLVLIELITSYIELGYHTPWSEMYDGVMDRARTGTPGRHLVQQFEYVRLRWPSNKDHNNIRKWLHSFDDNSAIWIITLSLADIDVILDYDDNIINGHDHYTATLLHQQQQQQQHSGGHGQHGHGPGHSEDGDSAATVPPPPTPLPPLSSAAFVDTDLSAWQRSRFTRQLEHAAELCESRWCNGSVVIALTKTDIFASKILAHGVRSVHVSYPEWKLPPMPPTSASPASSPASSSSSGHGDYHMVNLAYRYVYGRVHERFSYLYHGNRVRKCVYHTTLPSDHIYWLQQKNDLITPFTDFSP